MRFVRLCVLSAVALVAVATSAVPTGEAADQRLLIMLHTPAPHYNPGAPILIGYGSSGVRLRVSKTARAIAGKYGLSVLDACQKKAPLRDFRNSNF